MMPHPGWFARTALLGLVATLSGCILLYDEPAAGGAVAGPGSGASGGAGGAGAGGAGAGGTAGPGGGGSGGNPACSDCGPAGCDSNDVCVISTSASNPVQRVLFVRGQEQLPSSGYVVAHASPAAPADEESLLAWPIEFEQDAPLSPFTVPDPGVGFVAAGGQDHFYYFGQGQSCDGDPEGGDSCINVCSVSAAGVDCGNSRALTQGHHVNGAVAQVSADAPDGDVVFFVEADEGADEQLWNVNRACLEETEGDCVATGVVSYNAPDELNPLGLDRHDQDGSLWWNTWAGAPGLACVYNFPGSGSVPLDCVPTEPPIARPNRLTVSGTSVFVGTYAAAPPGGTEPGPIQQLHRCTAQGKRPVTTLAAARWPADADGQLLYATSSQRADELIVLNANTGETVATYVLPGGAEPISWVDASNPTYVLFAAGSTVFRMVKPTKPCTEQPGASICGNGCRETGEDCDDGNSVDGDACSTNCKCSLPEG